MESVKFLSPRILSARLWGSVAVCTETYCNNTGENLATEEVLKHCGVDTIRELTPYTRPTERKRRT